MRFMLPTDNGGTQVTLYYLAGDRANQFGGTYATPQSRASLQMVSVMCLDVAVEIHRCSCILLRATENACSEIW